MYNLTHEVVVNEKKAIKNILDIRVEKNVDALSDTAVVRIPSMNKNAWLEVEKNLQEGDTIQISFGYDQFHEELELSGYIRSIANENNAITLSCEDNLYTFRREIPNKVLSKATPVDVVHYVVEALRKQSPGMGLFVTAGAGVDDIKFTRFVIRNATGYDVLKKLKEQSKIDIYSRGPGLYLTLRYLPDEKVENTVIHYDFSKNIEKHSLKYVKEQSKKVQVHMVNIERNNERIEVKVGTPGGDIIKINRYNIADKKTLKKIAEEELKKWQYTGYEGSFSTWLLPYCTYGYLANIKDEQYPKREGKYYVEKVISTFSAKGGKRTVFLGKKVGG